MAIDYGPKRGRGIVKKIGIVALVVVIIVSVSLCSSIMKTQWYNIYSGKFNIKAGESLKYDFSIPISAEVKIEAESSGNKLTYKIRKEDGSVVIGSEKRDSKNYEIDLHLESGNYSFVVVDETLGILSDSTSGVAVDIRAFY